MQETMNNHIVKRNINIDNIDKNSLEFIVAHDIQSIASILFPSEGEIETSKLLCSRISIKYRDSILINKKPIHNYIANYQYMDKGDYILIDRVADFIFKDLKRKILCSLKFWCDRYAIGDNEILFTIERKISDKVDLNNIKNNIETLALVHKGCSKSHKE